MGNYLSQLSSNEDFLSANLTSSQLVHRQTLSTCYDAIFDLSLSAERELILLSDDGRLRLFELDGQLTEVERSLKKKFEQEQIHDLLWSEFFRQFLVLTSKRLVLHDREANLVDLDLQLEKSSPPLWRMACWSSHFILNLGLGTSLSYYHLQTTPAAQRIKSYSRSSLGYSNSDLLSTMLLSPQLILGINVELADNHHLIDLLSISNPANLHRLKRIETNNPCPLDLITSLRDFTWLCKSHWPSDDCLCLIESDGEVKRIPGVDLDGYVLNLRVSLHRSHVVLIRTASKLPKEVDIDALNQIDQEEENDARTRGRRREVIGKLPGNLVLEIYKVKGE